ncbi:MAG: hypothetical protein JWN78_276 [Bacteroidota bacterium]|nr:hypothetical protein [Bacteroidota bacterium]
MVILELNNMKAVIPFFFFSFILFACTKNTINEDTAGEVYKKYSGYYTASGSQIRYRIGIDTTTSDDAFDMVITKMANTGAPGDSEFIESRLTIDNFLGSGTTIDANATYTNIYPFTSVALPTFRNIEIKSENKSILDYSYYKVNGTGDTSWFSGKATKIK